MPPPLVGDLVRGYFLDEAGKFVVDLPEKHPSLCRIGIGRDREINQVRPGLAKIKIWLLRDVDLAVGSLAEVHTAKLQLRARLFEGVLSHAAGCQRLQRATPAQVVGQFAEVVTGNLISSDFIRQIELLIIAVVESGDCD